MKLGEVIGSLSMFEMSLSDKDQGKKEEVAFVVGTKNGSM